MNPSINDKGQRIDELINEIREIYNGFGFKSNNKSFDDYLNSLIDDYNKKIDSHSLRNSILVLEDEESIYYNFIMHLTSIKEELSKELETFQKCSLYVSNIVCIDVSPNLNDPVFKKIVFFKEFLDKTKSNKTKEFDKLLANYQMKFIDIVRNIEIKIKSNYGLIERKNQDDIKTDSLNKIISDFEFDIDSFITSTGITPYLLTEENIELFFGNKKDSEKSQLYTLIKEAENLYKIVKDKRSKIIYPIKDIDYLLKYIDEYLKNNFDNRLHDIINGLNIINIKLDELNNTISFDGPTDVFKLSANNDFLDDSKNIFYKKLGCAKEVYNTGSLTQFAVNVNPNSARTHLNEKQIKILCAYNKLANPSIDGLDWIEYDFTHSPFYNEKTFGFRPILKIDDISKLKGAERITSQIDAPRYKYGEYPYVIKRCPVDFDSDFTIDPLYETDKKITVLYRKKDRLSYYEFGNQRSLQVFEKKGNRYAFDGEYIIILKPIVWLYDDNTKCLISLDSLHAKDTVDLYPDYLQQDFISSIATYDMYTITHPLFKSIIDKLDNEVNGWIYGEPELEYNNLKKEIVNTLVTMCSSKGEYRDIASHDSFISSIERLKDKSSLKDEITLNKLFNKLTIFENKMSKLINSFNNIKKLISIIDGDRDNSELGNMLNSIDYIFNESVKSVTLSEKYKTIINDEKDYLDKISHKYRSFTDGDEVTFEELEMDFRRKLHPFLKELNMINNPNVEMSSVIKAKENQTRRDIYEDMKNLTSDLFKEVLNLDLDTNTLYKIDLIDARFRNVFRLKDDYSAADYVAMMNELKEIQKELIKIKTEVEFNKNNAGYKSNYKASTIK